MHDRDVLTGFLSRIAGRVRTRNILQDAMRAVACASCLVVVYQILLAVTQPGPSQQAVRTVLWLGLAVTACWLAWRAARPVAAEEAAAVADRTAGLRDLLKSAHWFAQRADASPMVAAHLRRAASTARDLAPEAAAPLQQPHGWGVSVALVVVAAASGWLVPQIARHWPRAAAVAVASPTSGAATVASRTGAASVATPDGKGGAAKPDGPDASGDKSGAGRDAGKGAAAQKPADASVDAKWRALENAVESLRGKRDVRALEAAIRSRDAERTAGLLEDMARRESAPSPARAAMLAPEQILASGPIKAMRQIQEMFGAAQRPDSPPTQEAGPRDTNSLLDQATGVARRLDESNNGPRDAPAKGSGDQPLPSRIDTSTPLTGKGDVKEGGGDGQGRSQDKAIQADANAGGDQPVSQSDRGEANQIGGNEKAESKGMGPSVELKGEQTARLRLKQKESILHSAQPATADSGETEPLYAATEAQRSMLDYRNPTSHPPGTREDAMTGERVPLAHQGVVRDYFLALKKKDKDK